MYATIQHSAQGMAPTDGLAAAGYALANSLSKAPGFVAYVFVAIPGSGHVADSSFTERIGPATAEELAAGRDPSDRVGSRPRLEVRITGEFIAQRACEMPDMPRQRRSAATAAP